MVCQGLDLVILLWGETPIQTADKLMACLWGNIANILTRVSNTICNATQTRSVNLYIAFLGRLRFTVMCLLNEKPNLKSLQLTVLLPSGNCCQWWSFVTKPPLTSSSTADYCKVPSHNAACRTLWVSVQRAFLPRKTRQHSVASSCDSYIHKKALYNSLLFFVPVTKGILDNQ